RLDVLGPRVGVLPVAPVDDLYSVEVPVAVGVRLVVGGQGLLGDHGPQDVVVAEPGVVRPSVADQGHLAVVPADRVAQRARQGRVPVVAERHRRVVAGRDGVVDHDTVDRPPRTLVVPVVVAPVAVFVVPDALRPQRGKKAVQAEGRSHQRSSYGPDRVSIAMATPSLSSASTSCCSPSSFVTRSQLSPSPESVTITPLRPISGHSLLLWPPALRGPP